MMQNYEDLIFFIENNIGIEMNEYQKSFLKKMCENDVSYVTFPRYTGRKYFFEGLRLMKQILGLN